MMTTAKIKLGEVRPHPAVTGVILSGGLNTRMGVNKAFIPILGRRIVDLLLQVMTPCFKEMMLITNAPQDYLDLDLMLVTDVQKGLGPFGGLLTALHYLETPYLFITACDTPFLNPRLIQGLLTRLPQGGDIIIPATPEGYQPLMALYSKRCLKVVEDFVKSGRRKIYEIFPYVKTVKVEPPELDVMDSQRYSFFNLNTPEDVVEAQRVALEAAPWLW
ncbi:MAG: molybdenum cofactor guanylyltransferase [Deltaproteobacteria bacterium]|nr:molybdenum cofactor guanylyltransferase [Deltaproteobacteria bacterium]